MNSAKHASFQTTDQKVSGSNPDGCAIDLEGFQRVRGRLKKTHPGHNPAIFEANALGYCSDFLFG